MVPITSCLTIRASYSPRIRGDGPHHVMLDYQGFLFSPYSRGWSPFFSCVVHNDDILPVFAGMVPFFRCSASVILHSPRIRGDGPYGSEGCQVLE